MISTLLKDLKRLQLFFPFFPPACHDLVNSHAGGSMKRCRSARLLKMQNTPRLGGGSGFRFIGRACIHIAEAAGDGSE